MHQAEVFTGSVGMCVGWCHRRFRGHTRVSYGVASRQLAEVIPCGNLGRMPFVFVKLDGTAHGQKMKLRKILSQPGPDLLGRDRSRQLRMVLEGLNVSLLLSRALKTVAEIEPVKLTLRREQAELT